MVKVGEVKALNHVEDNNWCGIIHNTFSEYKTIKQRCLILIQNLYIYIYIYNHNTRAFGISTLFANFCKKKKDYLQCAHRICCSKYGTDCWELKKKKLSPLEWRTDKAIHKPLVQRHYYQDNHPSQRFQCPTFKELRYTCFKHHHILYTWSSFQRQTKWDVKVRTYLELWQCVK